MLYENGNVLTIKIEANGKIWIRELCRKAFDEEFHFTNIIEFNSDKVIVLAKKHRASDINDDLTTKLHKRFGMGDDDGDVLSLRIPLDEHIKRCKMVCLSDRDEGFEI